MLPMIRHQWLSLFLLVFSLLGFAVFLFGYFPLKYHGGAEATWNDLPSEIENIKLDKLGLYMRNRTRVVLMVIDALRYDFVTQEYMPYTTSMIRNDSACLFRAQAEPPTVTMPRIKSTYWKRDKAQWRRTLNFWRDVFAMTTGSVSNFIDVALNFGSSVVTDDSFLQQARAQGKKMVFYGDDTWLRLFPDMFARSEGTTSFYVSDYTEVDKNVTRHLPSELSAPDWDVLILHYLGLDHIGHLEGPGSTKVPHKMKEMDDVVRSIAEAAKKWKDDTVLIVCGDHGMKDSGSHGGASHSEVTVPLVITQGKGCLTKEETLADQIDIAPTISYLLGLPIPSASTGQILPQVLSVGKDLSAKSSLYALHYNAKMNTEALVKTLGKEEAQNKECYKQYLSAVRHHRDFLSDEKASSASAKLASALYTSALSNTASYLVKAAVEYDMFALMMGALILFLTFLAQLCIFLIIFQENQSEKHFKSPNLHGRHSKSMPVRVIAVLWVTAFSSSMFIITCGIERDGSALCRGHPLSIATCATIITILVSTVCIMKATVKNIKIPQIFKNLNSIEVVLIVGTLIQALTYGGTSFIEEEHQTWYFFWVTISFLILVYTSRVLYEYIKKRRENSTEIQDKSDLEVRMRVTARWLLPQWAVIMVIHRALRSLNQTGDKWAFLPDLGDLMMEEENKEMLTVYFVTNLFWVAVICIKNLHKKKVFFKTNCFFIAAASICILIYRITSQSIYIPYELPEAYNETVIVRFFWVAILAMIGAEMLNGATTDFNAKFKYRMEFSNQGSATNSLYNVKTYPLSTQMNNSSTIDMNYEMEHPSSQLLSVSENKDVNDSLKMEILNSRTAVVVNIVLLTCALFLRPHNLIIVPCILVTSRVINKILDYKFGMRGFKMDANSDESESKNAFSKTLLHVWMGATFYFIQGNSNSLASVDVSSGYIGLQSYVPAVIILQMAVHTYAAPLIAGVLLFADCVRHNKQWSTFLLRRKEILSTLAVLKMYPLVVYTLVAYILRYHLFVWTVVSPKLLYDLVALIFSILAISVMAFLCYTVSLQEKYAVYINDKRMLYTNKGVVTKEQ